MKFEKMLALNDTNRFKKKMSSFGLDERITDVFLSSKIRIIEV